MMFSSENTFLSALKTFLVDW